MRPSAGIVIAVLAAAVFTVHAQSSEQPLPPKEAHELLNGNTFTGESDQGNGFHIYYKPDGSMYGLLYSGPWKGDTDEGTWEVTDEKGHCRRWSRWGKGEEECFRMYRDGEKVRYEQVSAYRRRKGAGVMRKGNPENL